MSVPFVFSDYTTGGQASFFPSSPDQQFNMIPFPIMDPACRDWLPLIAAAQSCPRSKRPAHSTTPALFFALPSYDRPSDFATLVGLASWSIPWLIGLS